MCKTINLLYFIDRMGRGGIQTLVYDLVSNFDKDKIKVDFLLLDDGNEYDLEKKLIEDGYKVYKLNGVWVRKPTDFLKLSKELEKFFKEHHDYDAVHLHSTSKNYMVLKKAKKYGISVRIAHSHSTGFQSKNYFKTVFGTYLKSKLVKYSTDFFACSKAAGIWLFGKKVVKSSNFKIMNNGIYYEKFQFNTDIRKKIRKQLEINDNTTVIGHVGRFTKVKNHEFLINIFQEYEKNNKNSKLLLIGTGPLEDEIKQLVSDYHLNDKVIFAGIKKNPNDYLQAMDCFVFPSLYEGLGIALIEAQANGLKCFTSKDVVPQEANVSKSVEYISLKSSPKIWADQISESNLTRKNYKKNIIDAGYNITEIANELTNFYFEKMRLEG